MDRINEWVMRNASSVLSSPWLGYVFVLIVIAVIVLSPPTSLQAALLDFFSIFVQTVALVVINNTTAKESADTRGLIQETHDTVMDEHKELKEVLSDVTELVSQIHKKVHNGDS